MRELEILYDTVMNADKVGGILLGGSVPKHAIMNAFMLRDGGDYTVYINTGYEGEGSNAGANPEEAKSWGKALPDENNVKVWGEASIIFPTSGGGRLQAKVKSGIFLSGDTLHFYLFIYH